MSHRCSTKSSLKRSSSSGKDDLVVFDLSTEDEAESDEEDDDIDSIQLWNKENINESLLPACEYTNMFDEEVENDILAVGNGAQVDCTSSSTSSSSSSNATSSSSNRTSTDDGIDNANRSEVKIISVINIDDDDDDKIQEMKQKNTCGNIHSNIDMTCSSSSSSTLKKRSRNACDEDPLFDLDPESSSLLTDIANDADAQLAAQLQAEEHEKAKKATDINDDARMAAHLQAQEDALQADCKRRKIEEDNCMKESPSGRAWLFIQQVLHLHQELLQQQQEKKQIETVAVDDMVYTCEKLIQCQETFRQQNHPTHITIGYHYTEPTSMDNIRQHGLLSKQERDDVVEGEIKCHGAVFGDGIYTANNPQAFKHYGRVGLLVATLRGKTERVTSSCVLRRLKQKNGDDDAHTVIGNKRNEGGSNPTVSPCPYDEIVLRRSSQCLPLIRYESSMAPDEVVWKYHVEMQKLVDKFFNGGVETKCKRLKKRDKYKHHSSMRPLIPPMIGNTGLFPGPTVWNNGYASNCKINGATSSSGIGNGSLSTCLNAFGTGSTSNTTGTHGSAYSTTINGTTPSSVIGNSFLTSLNAYGTGSASSRTVGMQGPVNCNRGRSGTTSSSG